RVRPPTPAPLYHNSSPTSVLTLSSSSPRHCAHRTLHSFPTRRSSDLYRWTRSTVPPRSRAKRVCCSWSARRSRSTRSRADHEQRSEEHTSELQSPDHLVCRLLLEKKKKTVPCIIA